MKQKKYVIGLDFGTLSARAIMTDVDNGEIVASAVRDYTHGVIEKCLPDEFTRLGQDWYLQYPDDYIEAMLATVNDIMRASGVPCESVIALSMDFTASTILPVDENDEPLCRKEAFVHRPHAYVKMWKHHAAQPETDEINQKLDAIPNDVVARYGKRIPAELYLPKVLQIINEDAEVYRSADRILEAADWLCCILTGQRKRSVNLAGYKAMYFENGYPSREFFGAIHAELGCTAYDKLCGRICGIEEPFGALMPFWAEKMSLCAGIAVGCGMIDGHACLIGCGIMKPDQMMIALGTSSVQAMLSPVPHSNLCHGVIGAIKDCVVPGYYAWETGLAAVGDQLAWFVDRVVSYHHEPNENRKDVIMADLTREAGRLAPGESGLLALDWWNGNRTPFVNGNLSGMIVGLKLDTTAAQIFRALIESTAYGTKRIMDEFADERKKQIEIIACGGIVDKNPLMMQIYADVLGCEIKLANCPQTAALGAAVIAAVAAGADKGGYATLEEAAAHMTHIRSRTYKPCMRNNEAYRKRYRLYRQLSEDFGKNNALFSLLKGDNTI